MATSAETARATDYGGLTPAQIAKMRRETARMKRATARLRERVPKCKPGEHVPGTEVVEFSFPRGEDGRRGYEIGTTMYGGAEFWSALTDREELTVLCARCRAPLEVSLRARSHRL